MIYLISATIRPEEYKKTEKIWREKSYNDADIVSKVIVDTPEHEKILSSHYDCDVYGIKAGGITKPLTQLTRDMVNWVEDDDIIIVLSDDFYPPKHWDKYLREFFNKNLGALSVKIDGLNDGSRDDIISIPILDGYTLKSLNGYVYHPAYNHLYSDNELYDNLKYLNLLHIDTDPSSPKFKHAHWTTGDRSKDVHDKNTHMYVNEDKKLYFKRKKMNFTDRVKDTPLLSLLICSLKNRQQKLKRLVDVLNPQLKDKNVELKICVDDGHMTIPQKRNHLLNNSLGEYVCFIDDDDIVSKNYIDEIIQATLTRPDVIGIVGNYYHNGEYKKDFIHSIRYNKWRETDKVYERNPNHLNPIRREFIFKIGGFDESKTWGEDKDLSSRIFKYLKTEVMVDKPIYRYLYNTK